jgi:flagellin
MRINTNVSSMNAIESATNTSVNTKNSLEKLSSGLRINKASDDASGLAIADKLRTQKSSLEQSIGNANSAVALIQIADKAMGEQSNILDIVKTKLIQASTATTSSEGRDAISKDINKLLNQLDGIARQTNYNGINLLQESSASTGAASALTFQMGEKDNNTISTSGSIQSNTIGLASSSPTNNMADLKTDTTGSTLSATDARSYMAVVDLAIDDLNTMRSNFGSTQNQIESATRNMMTAQTNIAAAESVIRDVDFAEESARFNKLNIIGQASTYAQSQANAVPQSILKLLN